MRRIIDLFRSIEANLSVVAAAAGLAVVMMFGGQSALAQNKMVPGEIILSVRAEMPRAEVNALAAAQNATVVEYFGKLGFDTTTVHYRLKLNGANVAEQTTLDAIRAVKGNANVKFAGPNRILKFHQVSPPNDPRYNKQFGHVIQRIPQAWNIEPGKPGTVVVIIDSGTDIDHEDFDKNRLFIPDTTGTGGGFDASSANGGNNPRPDTVAHGTHVAGISIANTNNGKGIAGAVYSGVRLLPIKLGDAPTTAAQIRAFQFVINQKQANPAVQFVANCSFGGATNSDTPPPYDSLSPDEKLIVDMARTNVVVCISAGNDGDGNNPPTSPAYLAQSDARILCIASVGPNARRAYYSTFRPYTTIAAVGGDQSNAADDGVISTIPGNQYEYYQGTSMAAPYATGIIALMLSAGATPSDVKRLVTSTAQRVPGAAVPSPEYGFGIIDAGSAVAALSSAPSVVSPVDNDFVWGSVDVQVQVRIPGSVSKFDVTIDNDPTIVATSSSAPFSLTWDSLAKDPQGNLKYANGKRRINVIATTTTGVITVPINVNLDNPIAILTSPTAGATVSSFPSSSVPAPVAVLGTVAALRRPTYTLSYALASDPTNFTPVTGVVNVAGTVDAAKIGDWQTRDLPDGAAILRLSVKNQGGFVVNKDVNVTIDQTAPNSPSNLIAVQGNRQLVLSWRDNSSPGSGAAVGFKLMRSLNSLTGFAPANGGGVITGTTFTDTGLTNGVTYFYKVLALDAAGNESSASNPASETPNRNGVASGQVVGLDGTFLGGVSVTLLQGGTVVSGVAPAVVDPSGSYTFPTATGIPAGTYDLRATLDGFVPQLFPDVTVGLGKDATGVNLVMQQQPQFPAGWSLFTLPYSYRGASLSTVLRTGSGPANVRYYNPTSGTYLSPGDPGFPAPAPGIGYFVNRAGTSPTVEAPGIATPVDKSVDIPIKRGWNLIGNPFRDPMRWVLNNLIITRSDSGQSATLPAAADLGWALDFAWGGADGKSLIYDRNVVPGVTSSIGGFGGFWFYSLVDGSIRITPPPVVTRSAVDARPSSSATGQWIARLNAVSDGQTSTAYFGVGSQSRSFPVAPSVSNGVRLSLIPDGAAANSAGLGVDLRSSSALKQTWTMRVDGLNDKPVAISWPDVSLVPRGFNVALLDKGNGRRINMKNSSGFTLTPAGRSSQELTVELTRATMTQLVIRNLSVQTSRSSGSARVVFSTTQDAQTTISILKSNGDAIRTLANRSVPSGDAQVVWDGKDDAGRAVAPGTYLVQVRAVADSGETARQVMVFTVVR